MLSGQRPSDLFSQVMNTSLILYAEHEFNASTFTARVCASTLSDLHSCIAGAIGSLRGPLHGGANEAAMEMIQAWQSPDEAEEALLGMLARKEKIMGFGHAIYQNQTLVMRSSSNGRKSSRVRWVTRCCIQFLCAVRKSCGVRNVCSATQTSFMHPLTISWASRPNFLPRYLLCPDSPAGQRMSKSSEPTIGSYDPVRIISGRSHLNGSTSATAERQRIPVFKLLLDYRLTRNSPTGILTGRPSALDLRPF